MFKCSFTFRFFFFFFLMIRRPPRSTLFPYRRSSDLTEACIVLGVVAGFNSLHALTVHNNEPERTSRPFDRSEEHTSELQSRSDLVCRLLLEKKKKITY